MKLLIADDEEYTRLGIRDSFDWESLGFDSVALARDGAEALRIAKWFAPDLIITDVKMPQMDGIEFAREILRLLPRCKLLFISGYIEVDYFKSALKLDAVDYIVKPIDKEELRRAVRKALDALEKQKRIEEIQLDNREMKRVRLLWAMIRSEPMEEWMDELCRELHFPKKSPYVFLIVRSSRPARIPMLKAAVRQRLDRASFPFLLDYVDELGVICVCCCGFRQVRAAGKEILQEPELFLGVGTEVRDRSDVGKSCAAALRALEDRFFFPEKQLFEAVERPSPRLKLDAGLYSRFASLLRDNSGDLRKWFAELFGVVEASGGAYSPDELKTVFAGLVQGLLHQWKGSVRYLKSVSQEEEVEEYFRSVGSFAELKAFVEEVLSAQEAEYQAQNSYSKVVQDVLRYIEGHYADSELSVQEIAEHAHLSTTYLSIVFKKETKKTLRQFIGDYRLEKARRLLENERYKITDIAERCGYANANYFARVFRESEGMTPVEYRERGKP